MRGLELSRDVDAVWRVLDALIEPIAVLDDGLTIRFFEGLEQGIDAALRRLGEATQVSRVYIFDTVPGEGGEWLASQRHEWVAEGVKPEIAGVQRPEGDAVDALMRVTRALGLVGAEVKLSGLSPESARALVEMGADWKGLATHGTLQAAIAAALRSVRKG